MQVLQREWIKIQHEKKRMDRLPEVQWLWKHEMDAEEMKSDTDTIIKALRVLARDIQSDDGVANAALSEAADRLQEQQERIKRLERALEIIATADYRGNRSCESQLAYNALNFNP